MFFDDIDDASARLIVQLQLEDSEEITASVLNGQSGSGVQAGEQSGLLAALMLKEDMQRNEAFLQDRGTAITLGMETTSTSRTRLEDDGAPAQVRFLETETAAEPSATPAILSQPRIQLPVHPTSPLDRVPCTICQDEFPARDLAKLPCGDEYCFTCLVQTFTQSFRDEELYPPRCCQRTIPLRALRTRLTLDITATFLAKEEEFGGKNRVYCSGRGCETFLTADMTVSPDISKCWTCQAETCVKCKTVAHAGDCPKDEAADQLRALAESEGWKSCPGCKRMVELTVGCFHMSCPCKTQFCYLCGAHPWKACECPQWEEDLLFDRANDVLQAQNRANGIEGPAALADVVQMADQLHAHHNCHHPRWKSLYGENDCSMCHKTMPEFINRCVQCEILVCRKCKKNRL
ncbi:hypothetical protein WAI453_011144 [Rhynchosporium graminicola]